MVQGARLCHQHLTLSPEIRLPGTALITYNRGAERGPASATSSDSDGARLAGENGASPQFETRGSSAAEVTRSNGDPVRILLVSPYDITLPGGVTSHVLDLAYQFQALGHPTMLVGPGGGGTLPSNGFTHAICGAFRVPSPGDAARVNINPLIIRSVRSFLAKREFDVIHIHEPLLPFLGPSFLRVANGIKIGTFHTWRQGPHLPYLFGRPLIQYWARKLHGRIAVSPAALSTIARYAPGDYRIIPNGVHYDRFATPGPCPVHLDDDRPTVLYVGRLEARKGIPYLLRGFRLLKDSVKTARLVVVGTGGLETE